MSALVVRSRRSNAAADPEAYHCNRRLRISHPSRTVSWLVYTALPHTKYCSSTCLLCGKWTKIGPTANKIVCHFRKDDLII